jgi:hypothetical protein
MADLLSADCGLRIFRMAVSLAARHAHGEWELNELLRPSIPQSAIAAREAHLRHGNPQLNR